MIPMVRACTREIMARRLEAYRHRVSVLCPGVNANALSDVEDAKRGSKAFARGGWFLQTFNLHRDGKSAAREFIMSKRFAKIAADLMGAKRRAFTSRASSSRNRAWRRRIGTAT